MPICLIVFLQYLVSYAGTWSGNILRLLNRGLESASTNKASSKSAILCRKSATPFSRTRLKLRKYHSKVSVLNAVCCSCAVWYNAHPPKFKCLLPKISFKSIFLPSAIIKLKHYGSKNKSAVLWS